MVSGNMETSLSAESVYFQTPRAPTTVACPLVYLAERVYADTFVDRGVDTTVYSTIADISADASASYTVFASGELEGEFDKTTRAAHVMDWDYAAVGCSHFGLRQAISIETMELNKTAEVYSALDGLVVVATRLSQALANLNVLARYPVPCTAQSWVHTAGSARRVRFVVLLSA